MYVLLIIVVILLFAAYYDGYRNNRKKEELTVLTDRQKELRDQLKDISIKQAIALKGMVENGAITRERYYHEMDLVYQQCVIHEIDVSILKDIKPDRILTRMDVQQSLLKIATRLNDEGGMSENEFNDTINETLDRK